MPEWDNGGGEPPEWLFSWWFMLLVAILFLACVGIALNTDPQ